MTKPPASSGRAALAIVVFLVAILFPTSPEASATMYAPGGGGDYCPAEFHSCPGGGSWCTWYGTCAGDIDWGGSGGGSDWEPDYVDPTCGKNGAATLVDGWIVKDLGTCSTKAICRAKRDAINRHGKMTSRAYCWANWNSPNSNGRHLVFARPAGG